jgi:excisionase family DNA binding protein
MKIRLEHIYTGRRNFMTITKELLTRKDVAQLCQVSPQSVIRWELDGKLPAIRLGAGSVRYERAAVEQFLKGCANATQA